METNNNLYRDLVFNSPTGYALHEIILDENSKPVDYVFLEVNVAFEKFTGLEASKILNKRITEVIPNIKNDDTDWIAEYGRIAIANGTKEFIQHSSALDKYFKIKVFSPQKGFFITLFSDASYERGLENQLLYEQKLLQKYLDTADNMFLVLNTDGNVVSINKKGCEILGYEENHVLGKNWFDNFIPEHQRKEVKPIFNKIINGEIENVRFFENAVINANGEERFIYWHNTILRNHSGEIESILSSGNDITERKHAENKLRESEEKFRYVFDNSVVGKSLTKPNGEIMVNDSFCRMLGYSREELLGMNWKDISHPDDIEASNNEIDMLLKGKKDAARFEKRYIKKNGSVLWAYVSTSIRWDENGNPLYFMTSILDITDRKKAEKALIESQAFLQAAFDNSQAGIAIADAPDGRLRYVNRAGLLIRDKSEDEIVNKVDYHKYVDTWNILHLDGTPYKDDEVPLARAVLYGDHCSEEFIIRRDNNEDRYVLANAAPIKDKNDNIIAGIVVFLDITDKKELENKRLLLESQLRNQQKLESIGTLASGVAHEINNPINGILNYGQLILDAKTGNDEVDEYASEIIDETMRVATIVSNLLDFSRHHKQEHSYADMGDIITKTVSLINTIYRSDQIQLNLNINPHLSKIKCRSQQLQQVIMNLLTNSRDALNEAYPNYDENKVINIYCSEFISEDRKWLKLIIEDFGTGIPDDIKDNIFDPFFTTKGRDKGTGLGLSISYNIIKEHHGSMSVESKENEFTRFIVVLPCDNGWDLDKRDDNYL